MSMRTQVTSSDQEILPLWRSLIWDGRRLVVVAVWLGTCCVSVRAEDSKLTHIQEPAAQQKVTTTKDEKATITNGSDAACKAKPDDPVVKPDIGEAASSAEKGGQELMSRAGDKASSG